MFTIGSAERSDGDAVPVKPARGAKPAAKPARRAAKPEAPARRSRRAA